MPKLANFSQVFAYEWNNDISYVLSVHYDQKGAYYETDRLRI